MESFMYKSQKIRVSGAGVAHQNRLDERRIKNIINMTRKMLTHASINILEENLMKLDNHKSMEREFQNFLEYADSL